MNIVKTVSPRENTDFLWEKPQKLPSAEANFKGVTSAIWKQKSQNEQRKFLF